ncbi:transcription initiation protein spt5 [Rhizodiscina lignyota]|uniref:Transcription elongation factor SPT5 n=1 Tax=Rhizodiscina lignyota TaxID=1504668 RepID=A0A9P4IJ52_9PEZI|nr:transcription initiation protein spt5 [Rhizodiscina lignyota]
MSNLLNHDFDDEESDDEFNPAPEVDSGDEKGANRSDDGQSGKPSRVSNGAARKSREAEDDEDDDAEDGEPKAKAGAGGDAEDDVNDDEDAEGEGEDDDEQGGAEDDDDEDEDEDEDDEEEEVSGRPRKRRRRDRRMQFIDAEAEVDDEEEEEEEGDEDDLAGDEAHPDDLADLPAGAETDDRRHRELDRQRELAASMDAEKQAEALRERYGRQRRAAADVSLQPWQTFLPEADKDPKIWVVRCKQGKEREIVLTLMKKLDDAKRAGKPLGVTSAFTREGTTSGYIYVEAWNQMAVERATEDVQNLYPRSKITLIPVSEMPDLLRTQKDKQLTEGMYVRIKRGLYTGDLAQVYEVVNNGSEVEVRLVPRVDYGVSEDLNAPATDGKRKRPGGLTGNRPPARLFSEAEARKKMAKYLQPQGNLKRNHFNFRGKEYIDGFLHEYYKLPALQTENVNPTLEEVSKFVASDEAGDNLDLGALAQTMKQNASGADYIPGDTVEIYQGEQRGVWGKAVAVTGDIVSIKVMDGPLRGQTVDSSVKGLRKMFKEGDHVKVIGASKYRDEVGMVVKVTADRVTMITDATEKEVEVFSKDLREAADSSGMQQGISKYDLFDLVQLDAAHVAVVIKVDRDAIRILDQENSVRTLLPSNISHKIERRRNAVATDHEGSEIRFEDVVKEVSGENRQGRVIHIHRSWVFVQDRNRMENSGVFAARSNAVTTVAAKGGAVTSAGPDLSKMNPSLQRPGGPNGGPMGPPKTMGRDKMIGKTVMIRKGVYKGLIGIVKDATDSEARVELHSKNKTIAIPKESLVVKDPITGNTIDYSKFASGSRRPGGMGPPQSPWGGATPSSRVPNGAGWQGGRTPMAARGNATPAWSMQQDRKPAGWERDEGGSKTPGWHRGNDGGRTPGWADGSRTVAHRPNDGSRTSYGGATAYGGRRPQSTWSASSKTPAAGNHGFSSSSGGDPWATGSRTPFHSSSSSRTPNPYNAAPTPGALNAPTPGGPSWQNNSHAGATPGGFDAPTPGVYAAPTPGAAADHPTPAAYGGGRGGLSAPTPGAMDAPTPGARYGAPTPGAGYAETPGAWAAGTPAAANDDDPRYE